VVDDSLELHTPSGIPIQCWITRDRLWDGRAGFEAALPSRGIKRDVASGPTSLPSPRDGATHSIRIGMVAVGLPVRGCVFVGDEYLEQAVHGLLNCGDDAIPRLAFVVP
jgi:hypothetical protein